MLVKSSRVFLALVLASAVSVTAWGQQQAPQKNYKDRAEYDLLSSILKETNANQKLTLLNQWKQKYPETEFKEERLQLYLDTYRSLNQGAKVLETAKEMVAQNPQSGPGLLWINLMTVSLNDTSPDALNTGEQAARSLLANLDTIFAAEKKPAQMNDEQWKKEKTNVHAIAQTTLGWVAWQRKNFEVAEQEFTKSLELNPANGQVSYWLGTVILAQRKPETQSKALYHFARAANYDGPGALDPNVRSQVQAYLEKVYTNYHGDKSGLSEIIARVKTQPMPPADFKIESATEIAVRKEEEFKKTNPMLALWMSIRKELTGPQGVEYFETRMKNAALPGGAAGVERFKGTVISMTPANRPKEVVIGIADANTPEVTLKFETPLPNKAEPGTQIEFEGVATAFTPDPFMITFDVEKDKLVGWPAPTPAKKAAPRKKKK